jgi:hypothetical protein
MESVLARVKLTTADLCLVGAREEAENILQRENERAMREIAALDVPPQHFAARRDAILDKIAWDATRYPAFILR